VKQHPSFDQLRSLSSGPRAANGNALAHVAECLVCRDTIDWFGRVRSATRDATALPAPALAWESIVQRIGAQEKVVLPVRALPVLSYGDGRTYRYAIAAALLITTVVAAAVPNSPLRRWLGEAFSRPPAAVAPIMPVRTTPVAPSEPETVLIVQPMDETVTIVLEQPAAGVRVRVRISESGAVELRASAGAANAQFRSGNGRLTISNLAAGELTLTLPQALRRARIEVNGSVYLSKERGQLRIFAPVADTVGSEIVLPITRDRPEAK
jgi:hypothetical protein